jgi:hypothetical protein
MSVEIHAAIVGESSARFCRRRRVFAGIAIELPGELALDRETVCGLL